MHKSALGQNFLKDKKILQKISNLAIPNILIIEIGPGKGALTKYLSKKARVLAIEKDKKFKPYLKKIKNTKIVFADALEFLEKYIPRSEYQIFGNLPYRIEKPIIHKVIKLKKQPQKAVFLIQKEVALPFKNNKKSLFALTVEFFAKCNYLLTVSKKSFYPVPKVDGAVIEIKDFNFPLPHNLNREIIEKKFFEFLKIGFKSPRKKLINNLSDLDIEKNILKEKFKYLKIKEETRPQELNIEKWLNLYYLLIK